MSSMFRIPCRLVVPVLVAGYCLQSFADSPTPEGMKGWVYDFSGYGPVFFTNRRQLRPAEL